MYLRPYALWDSWSSGLVSRLWCEKLPGESRLNRDLNPRFSTCEANVLNTDLSGQLDITEWGHVPQTLCFMG